MADGGQAGDWYIGIWYAKIAVQTPVWVANRTKPITNPASSELTISPDGNLSLVDRSNSVIWSTNASPTGSATIAVLLDTGNLVLALESNTSDVLWQNSNHFGDTWLPGGKLRRDKRTGAVQRMVSWRSHGNPARGMYSLQLDPAGSPQYVLLWNGTREYWASGNWTGRSFSGAPEVDADSGGSGYTFRFVDNDRESYFTYDFANNATIYRFVMDVSGQIKGLFWVEATQAWNLVYAEPKAKCAVPLGCGAFAACSDTASASCSCHRGFSPRNPKNCGLGDYTGGCKRNVQLQCEMNNTDSRSKVKRDRFFQMDTVRLPDNGQSASAASSGDCELACLGNCSFSAYAYNGTCFLWYSELVNLQDGAAVVGEPSLHLRLAASELPGSRINHRRVVAIVIGATVVVAFATIVSVLVCRRRRRVKGLTVAEGCVTGFRYRDLQLVTKNFSDKLGGGAFGSVFKGQLPDRTAVAVKKLEGLRQGDKQFRAEVSTLGTIQHVNLIRLLGFCSEGARRLLVYEYMPNGALDQHLFRTTTTSSSSQTLSWSTRYHIALGIAKGLAYLHDKCRDCIIHCDIEPQNILLDASFVLKVADFGLAKLVGREFSSVLTTMRGTVGYLAPEWISGEAVTAKADVFSDGMMLFEIISGKRNVEHDGEPAIRSDAFFPYWSQPGDVEKLLDYELDGNEASLEEVRRACTAACWCIEHGVDSRPTLAEVVQILGGLVHVNVPPMPSYLQVLAGQPMAPISSS